MTGGSQVEASPRGGASALPEAMDPNWSFGEGDQITDDVSALRLLGRAHRYEAYLAWHETMLATVVVKILRPDRVPDPRALEGLAAEARAIAALDHPVLLRSFGHVLDGPRPHLVLEFLEGPRLSTLIRKYGPVAIEQAVPLATQLCSAVHFMATRGWVHLDVKPKNIIMGAPARLIDLSIARTIEDAASLSEQVGTDAYMAPEQCQPGTRGIPGPPADVWGLGVTLYEALTGHLPFGNPDGHRFPQLDERPQPFPKDTVPPVLAELVLACLQPDPRDRPTAREIARRLEPLIEALPRRPVIGRLRPRLR
jgi:eukaryotic-like serine/threonine-protein kinase